MIAVCVTFVLREGMARAFLPLVHAQARTSLAREPDCHQFDVCTTPGEDGTVFLYELYSDRSAFDLHLASEHFKTFDGESAPLVASKAVQIFGRVVQGDIATLEP